MPDTDQRSCTFNVFSETMSQSGPLYDALNAFEASWTYAVVEVASLAAVAMILHREQERVPLVYAS